MLFYLVRVANPAPLGLFAFGFTTILLEGGEPPHYPKQPFPSNTMSIKQLNHPIKKRLFKGGELIIAPLIIR